MFSTILLFVLLICLAGVLYPFPPFKTRKRAIGLSLVAFTVSLTAFMVEESNPELIAERTETANVAIAKAVNALDMGDVESAKLTLEALDYRAADQEASRIAEVEARITRVQTLPKLERFISDGDTSLEDKIGQIQNLWKSLGKPESAKTLLASDFEDSILKIVKPLPASNYDLNMKGYQLLALVTQASKDPNGSYAERASFYSEKLQTAQLKNKSCEEPNYAFTSQVPRLLKDPSSFKPIRVYLGSKDGKGSQAAFMDYYANNGFGGRVKQTATGNISLATCAFTLISP